MTKTSSTALFKSVLKFKSPLSITAWLMETGVGFADLVFPVQCTGCLGRVVTHRYPVCTRCLPTLERVPIATARRSISRLTHACDGFHLVLPLWMFDKAGTVQRIHSALKYKNQPLTGRRLGNLMAALLIAPLALDERPTLVIPIPLHRQRMLERGYNQSAQLARGLAATANIPFDASLLRRSRYTPTQTGFDHTQRIANVKGAFSMYPERRDIVRGAHVLLVDDVLTTGATLLAAAEPLHAAGAAAVSIATLAFARGL